MLIRLSRLFATAAAATNPVAYHLPVLQLPEPPKLRARSHSFLLKRWWSETPFQRNSPLAVPVYSLKTGTYTGTSVELNQQIFNQPLRRDLIYRLYFWRVNLNKFRTHLTRNITRTAGSGAKPRPQKGQGVARIGKKRAPGKHKGGKAHGAKPKVYSFHLNDKIKLAALRSLFSSKLFEGKVRIIDEDEIEEAKTKLLSEYLEKNLPERATACVITSARASPNFERAQRNIERIKWYNSRNFDVLDLIRLDRLMITREGLEELTSNILKSLYVSSRLSHMALLPECKFQCDTETKPPSQAESYDPSKPLQFRFKLLEDYLQTYEELKKSDPERLEREIKKTILGKQPS